MISKILENVEEKVLIASYIVTIPLLFAQVIFRYVFNNSLTWSEELARYIFIWQVWLGSAYCVVKNRHIRIDVFTDKLPEKARRLFEAFITLICIVFCAFMIYKGGKVVAMMIKFHQLSPALRIPMQFIYLCVPFSAALMLLHYVLNLIDLLKPRKEDKK